jgi:hypothetical protein
VVFNRQEFRALLDILDTQAQGARAPLPDIARPAPVRAMTPAQARRPLVGSQVGSP